MTDPRLASFWQLEFAKMTDAFDPVTMSALLAGASSAVGSIPPEYASLIDWEFINEAAIDYLYRYDISTLSGIHEATRKRVLQLIDQWVRSGEALPTLINRLSPLFGKTRAEAIGITEVTRIFAKGNEILWTSTGIVSGKMWRTARDEYVCPFCGPLDGKIVELNQDFQLSVSDVAGSPQMKAMLQDYTEEAGIAAAQKLLRERGSTAANPPYHPRCRCWISPVVSTFAVSEAMDRIAAGR